MFFYFLLILSYNINFKLSVENHLNIMEDVNIKRIHME